HEGMGRGPEFDEVDRDRCLVPTVDAPSRDRRSAAEVGDASLIHRDHLGHRPPPSGCSLFVPERALLGVGESSEEAGLAGAIASSAATPEEEMADDPRKTGKADRDRINVHQDYELRDWSKSLGVSPERLKEAVAKVGPIVADVRRELGKDLTPAFFA